MPGDDASEEITVTFMTPKLSRVNPTDGGTANVVVARPVAKRSRPSNHGAYPNRYPNQPRIRLCSAKFAGCTNHVLAAGT